MFFLSVFGITVASAEFVARTFSYEMECTLVEYRTNVTPSLHERKSRFLTVVDSDAESLAYLSMLLQRFNYPSISTTTAKETIEIVTTAVPLLMIISLNLKDMDSYDFIRLLKDDPKTSSVPLIAINKQEDAVVRKRCLDLGVVSCLYHPVSAESLYRVVQVSIEKNPRTGMRIQTNRPVRVNDVRNDGLFGAYTLDLSERGMFLRTMTPVAINTRLLLQIDLDGRLIITEAEVLYNCKAGEEPYKEPGVGLKFTRIDPKDQEYIRYCIMQEVTQGIAERKA